MIYTFKPEDRRYYEFLENVKMIPLLKLFLKEHRSRIETAFEQMLGEMRDEEKTERDTKFIKAMNCEEFVAIVEYTFCVMYSKNIFKVLQKKGNIELLVLSAYRLAEKMSKDAQEPSNVECVNHAIANCCNSVLSAYRAGN